MRFDVPAPGRQGGFVLITGMAILVALTIIGIGMVVLSTANLRTVNSMQAQLEARAAIQQLIDQLLSTNFTKDATTLAAVVQTYVVQPAGSTNPIDVTIAQRPCMQQFKKFSVNPRDPRVDTPQYKNCVQGADSYCADTLWRVSATVSQGWFGANESITQGVSVVVDIESGTFHDADKYDNNRNATGVGNEDNPFCGTV